MKNKRIFCLSFLLLIGVVVVFAQSDKEKAVLKLRNYYAQNYSTYPVRNKINKADTYLKQLNEEGAV